MIIIIITTWWHDVLVGSGCLRDCLKKRNLFSQNSGSWKSEIRLPTWLVSVKTLPLSHRWPPCHCVPTWPLPCVHGEREEQALWCLLQGHKYHHECPTFWTSSNPNYFSKYSSAHPITLGVKDSTCDFFFEFYFMYLFLYSRFLLVIYFIHISVYMSIPISQFIPSPPPPLLSLYPLVSICLFPTSVVSISALQTGSSAPFF